LNEEADAERDGNRDVEEGPRVTAGNLKNIVLQRDEWQLQWLFLKGGKLALQPIEVQLDGVSFLLLVQGLAILVFLILVIEEGLLTFDFLLQFIHLLDLVIYQLFSLALDFNDDDPRHNQQREPINCIERLHLILTLELDHHFCVKRDNCQDNHGEHQKHQGQNRMQLTFTFVVCLRVDIGLRHHLIPIPIIAAGIGSSTALETAVNLQVRVLLQVVL